MADYSGSGISYVDKLLGGGMLPGNGYLLEVETGTEEMAFIAAFMTEGLRQGNFLGFLVFDLPHEEFINRLTTFGADVRQALGSGSMIIGDLWGEGKYDPERKNSIWMTDNPTDPNSVLRLYYDLGEITAAKFKSGRYTGVRGVVYSLSSQIMTYKFESTYKMVIKGIQVGKQTGALTLNVLNPGMFSQTVVSSFEHVFDGVIVLAMKEIKDEFQRYIRIRKSPIAGFSTKMVPYQIVDKRLLLAK